MHPRGAEVGIKQFQPTRPRGTRRACRFRSPASRRVSTHASARDATPPPPAQRLRASRFNPRVREGRDGVDDISYLDLETFQPTRPRGTRRGRGESRQVIRGVSTHASARDATSQLTPVEAARSVSTHASARDATSTTPIRTTRSPRFQPTRPRGTRQWWRAPVRASAGRFNPRVREGRDLQRLVTRIETDMFQPTRPRGTRPSERSFSRNHGDVSTHASARDATWRRPGCIRAASSFNPRVREGRDVVSWFDLGMTALFQPTRPRGTRPPRAPNTGGAGSFQPTRPRGTRHGAINQGSRE